MVKMIRLLLLLVSIIGLLSLPAYADLVPMSWGFPTFTQNSSLSNFEQDFGFNNDFELSSVSFPTASSGLFGTSFPTITQITNQTSMAGVIKYSHRRAERAVFISLDQHGLLSCPVHGIPVTRPPGQLLCGWPYARYLIRLPGRTLCLPACSSRIFVFIYTNILINAIYIHN